MAYFEKVKDYVNIDINLPERKTTGSAGYDFEVAEDIVIPAYSDLMYQLNSYELFELKEKYPEDDSSAEYFQELQNLAKKHDEGFTLEEIAALTKRSGIKPTLVPTGVKCKLDPGTYLELSVRSSCPLKHWLVLANGVGIIDSDYWSNPSNDGHIYFQVINLSPFSIRLKKGDIIGQGIIKPYILVDNDRATGVRADGFGSTSK